MNQLWQVLPANEKLIGQLVNELNISPLLARLLVQRGISSPLDAALFLQPDLANLHDPFLMKDMDAAVDRLHTAIEQNEKILLYGDYDVDGTTAIALLHCFLQTRVAQLDYYIPDRYKEGYGFSKAGLEHSIRKGVQLIVTLDCGIQAVERTAEAKSAGIDVIVCDHHLAGEKLPDAVAVLDPKRTDCSYPFKELSGCAVAFKLVQAYCKKHELSDDHWLSLLDLLVVSLASDIVPLLGENRVLAHFGLKELNRSPRLGLRALIHQSGLNYPLTISDIVFGLAPKINAAGRLADADTAVHLLLATDPDIAAEYAAALARRNDLRKQVDRDMEREAEELWQQQVAKEDQKSIVLFDKNWHKGVLGIVASRIAERHQRPTVLLSESMGMLTGSARTVQRIDIHKAIGACSHLLLNFGGHQQAAGLRLAPEKLAEFKALFETEIIKMSIADQSAPIIEIADILELNHLDENLWKELSYLQPFGPGNRRPVFVSIAVKDSGRSRVLKGDHLRVVVKQDSDKETEAIAFGQAAKYPMLIKETVDICYTIEQNYWQGRRRLQLNIRDIVATGE